MKINRDYKLTINFGKKRTFIGMQIFLPLLRTSHLKNTSKILKELHPSVLTTECFNDAGLTFSEEVKNTELAHLFEHLILDNLCLLKIHQGAEYAEFTGKTSWNWVLDPYGYFRISIKTVDVNKELLEDAIFEAIYVFDKILEEYNTVVINSTMDTARYP